MELTNKRGVDLVLYCADEERRAIRAVNLFFSLAEAVLRRKERKSIHLSSSSLHEHFDSFADVLGLITNENFRLYRPTRERICPAITLHHWAYGDPESEVWTHINYFGEADLDIIDQRIKKELEAIGVSERRRNYENLLYDTKIVLGNMRNKGL